MMPPEIEEIFLAAAEMPARERKAYLDRECPDPNVRREVESLLRFDERSEAFLDDAVQDAARSAGGVRETATGDLLGPFRVVELIGRGGMGDVYRAERHDGQFAQTVAIKVLRGTRWRESMVRHLEEERAILVRHFEEERAILARLSHPNIANLLDGGYTPEGLPYYVMEHVDGYRSEEWAGGRRTRDVVRLFLDVCDAVSYAHRNLIVHRDLKPENILVARDGRAKAPIRPQRGR